MSQLAHAMLQNNGSIEEVSSLLKARSKGASPEEIHKEIVKIQRRKEKLEQQVQEAQQAHQEKLQQMQIENREDEQAAKIEEINTKGEWDYKVAEVRSVGFGKNQDLNNDNIPDALQITELQQKVRQKDEELQIKRDNLEFQKEKENNNKELKEKDLKIKQNKAKN